MKPLYIVKRERRRLGRYIRRGVIPKAKSAEDKDWMYINYLSQPLSRWRRDRIARHLAAGKE